MNLSAIVADLFPFLVLFYVFDSFIILRAGQLVFRSRLIGQYSLSQKRGLQIVSLSPLETTVVHNDRPIFLSSNALSFLPLESDHERSRIKATDLIALAYDSLNSIYRDRQHVTLNNEHTLRFATTQEAIVWTKFLQSIIRADAGSYAELVSIFETHQMDLEIAEQRVQEAQLPLRLAKWVSGLFFLWLFVLVPLKIYTDVYLAVSLAQILLACALLYMLSSILTWLMHRWIYGKEIGGHWLVFLTTIFTPLSLAHMHVHLSRGLLSGFHPLVAVALLTDKTTAGKYFAEKLRQLNEWFKQAEDDLLSEAIKTRIEGLNLISEKCQLDLDQGAQVIQRDPGSYAFCSNCKAEYRSGVENCHDCDVALTPFIESATP